MFTCEVCNKTFCGKHRLDILSRIHTNTSESLEEDDENIDFQIITFLHVESDSVSNHSDVLPFNIFLS